MDSPSWDSFFMTIAYVAAMKSKDKHTKIGAVVVGENKEIRATGYNGIVRGALDDVDERYERPEKYFWMEHAERNAIYNASLCGVCVKGCVMYTQGIPCMDCARAIVQSGIKEVVVHDLWTSKMTEQWVAHSKRTEELFKETGITLRKFRGYLILPKLVINGKELIVPIK